MLAGQERDTELSEQEWLFRQGDLVLGPLSGQQLVEKLYTGEMTADTLIAPPGARAFARMGDVEDFKVHVARAQAKARVDAEVRAERERTLRKRLILGGISLAVTAALAIGAWQAARWAAVHGTGSEEDEFAGITVDLPTITLAQARRDDQDLIAYPTNSPRPEKTPTEPRPKPAATPSTTTPSTSAAAVASKTEKKPAASATADPDGLQVATEFDQGAINKVVKNNQKTLFRCLKEEAERQPGLFAKVPIEFVIGNDGKVSKLYVDNPQYKKGPLYDCLLTELQKWPFKAYNGERASVGLAFTVGKKG
ncbi:MAG: AgmX/PglI C-terminal domain-containing protein [Hyalangium sp.]|uniref:AgmX/PglI C-terminal domain-containing protein n=1 Tax=Hyalangium sp. TaxID=2028555 RepID=UPI00389A7120